MTDVAGSINERLANLYEAWRASYTPQSVKTEVFSPPLLLRATPAFEQSSGRVVVYGQETAGWGWTAHSRQQGNYPKEPNLPDVNNLADFLKEPDAVEALCCGYSQFAFAEAHPGVRASPFWHAFREVQAFGAGEVIWSNLCRCDYDGGSFLLAPAAARAEFLNQQKSLVLSELEALQCSVCIFLTGPDYDHILDATFSGLVREDVGLPVREFCKLRHETLPVQAFRTYHPGYLRRGKRAYIERLKQLIAG